MSYSLPGEIANKAGVRRVIFTHLAVAAPYAQVAPLIESQTHETFKGDVRVARDLERFELKP